MLQSDGVAGQHHPGCLQRVDDGCTALELQVDVDDVQLVDQFHVVAVVGTFVVGVLIDDGDDLLRLQVVDVALARDVERGLLRRLVALDGEVALLVGQAAVVLLGDDPSRLDVRAGAVAVEVGHTDGSRVVLAAVEVGLRLLRRVREVYHLHPVLPFLLGQCPVGSRCDDLSLGVGYITA